MTNLIVLLFTAISTSLISLAGGFLLLIKSDLVDILKRYGSAFAAVVLLYAVFGDLIPEILEDSHLPIWQIALLILTGLLISAALSFIAHRFHRHGDSGKITTEGQALAMLIVDSIHTAIDGIAIGIAFSANIGTGILVACSTVAHEIPQEIGDFALMLRSKISPEQIVKVQIVSSLILVPASVIAFYVGGALTSHLPIILSIMAGSLLYIAFVAIVDTVNILRRPNKLSKHQA